MIAESGDGSIDDVNVGSRRNVVIVINTGAEDSSQRASAKQTIRIRQNGAETYEESEILRNSP